jgi:hypothetical protein
MKRLRLGILVRTRHKVAALSLAAVALLFGTTAAVAQERSDDACKQISCSMTDPLCPCAMWDHCGGLYGCDCYCGKLRKPYPPLPGPCMAPYDWRNPCQRGQYINNLKPLNEPIYPNQTLGDDDRRPRGSNRH